MSAPGASLRACGRTDMGRIRKENEDSFRILEPADPQVRERKGVLLLLADGMGGLDEGGAASGLAVETTAEAYYAAAAGPREALEQAVRQANRAIFNRSQSTGGGRPMGSTLTAVAVIGPRACVAQVGDSRAYCYRGGVLHQVTRDHSLVRELVDMGHLKEASPHYAFHRNILTRGLGLREDVAVDIFEIPGLAAGDRLLLTSDGLHELVRMQELSEVLTRRGSDLDGACEELVARACERGGPDNITVILAELAGGAPAAPLPNGVGRPVRVHPAAAWVLPLVMFLSFTAGVAMTLWLEGSTRVPAARLESLRQRVRALQSELGLAGDAEDERLQSLRRSLGELQRMLEDPER